MLTFIVFSYSYINDYSNKSLRISLKYFDNSLPNIASSYISIGQIEDELGNYKKALNYFKKSLNIRISVYGINHPIVASTYHNISFTFNRLKKYDSFPPVLIKFFVEYVWLKCPAFHNQNNHPLDFSNFFFVFASSHSLT